MKYEQFCEEMKEKAVKNGILGLTQDEHDVEWSKYKTARFMVENKEQARNMLTVTSNMDENWPKYQHLMVEKGYEMTPREVKIHLSMMTLLLQEYLNRHS